MLRLGHVHTSYGAVNALTDVSLKVEQGEIVTLIGANGAGKSTLLMTICGSPRASQGHVVFENEDITALPTHAVMRRGIAVAPEGRRVFSQLTVIENLSLGGYFLNKKQIARGLDYVHRLFPRLLERAGQRAGTLSGGEQQMLAIGRALMSQPRLLLLDEPTLGLAPLIIRQIFATISVIRDAGVTVLLVEQNASKALAVADRGYVLEAGRIVLAGSAANLLADDGVRRAYLGG